MTAEQFHQWLTAFGQITQKYQQRRLVLLVGKKNWAISLLTTIASFPLNNTLANKKDSWHVFSDNNIFTDQLTKVNYRAKLGTECRYLLFDDVELSIDAFTALSGTIRAGGFLFLLWPEPLDDSALIKNSFFLQRFFQQIQLDANVIVIDQQTPSITKNLTINANTIKFTKQVELIATSAEALSHGCASNEQFLALNAITKVFTGHRDRPLVLTADRGRGKSSVLAIACAQLMKTVKYSLNIVITAPDQQALVVFYQQLALNLPTAEGSNTKVSYFNGFCQHTLMFVPIDVLVKSRLKASLVLVDEAAAIPVYLLEKLVNFYHRIVFSTTQHGYEGAGRGFAIKFRQILKQNRPDWQALHLTQPIRWSNNDPLEQFVFSVALLDAELSDLEITLGEAKCDVSQLSFIELDQKELSQNEALLSEVFAVLVTAHYQTSPSDLQLILDNSAIHISVLLFEQRVIAVALLLREGNCEHEQVEAIKKAQRRVKNQFLPQSLLTHCGIETAFEFSYLRIMRIAVHPCWQRQGIGRFFLTQLTDFAQRNAIDFLGVSFGAHNTLLKFWLQADFCLARIGFSKDNASGEHSALLLKSMSKKSVSLCEHINQQFYRSFDYLLTDEYQQLAAPLVQLILNYKPIATLEKLTQVDHYALEAFANKQYLYSSCVYSLHLWLLQHLTMVSHDEVLPLIARILQKQSIVQVCQNYQFTGKKQFNLYLLDYVKKHFIKNEGSH